ncbi:hypothetical protein GGD68_004248 [Paraburkholderia fungorum]|jgi:hypothetical protein|uniref:Uncharacterized protein n=1 Tax=Paraburkholderia fungorum TaxID=134537 RepID=A0AAW3V154_9BURK|nr:hypothetical protein [Paraburkholderia fungorum]MBB6203407.1 hypothetical protein [Paraburkholderia fungorum]
MQLAPGNLNPRKRPRVAGKASFMSLMTQSYMDTARFARLIVM